MTKKFVPVEEDLRNKDYYTECEICGNEINVTNEDYYYVSIHKQTKEKGFNNTSTSKLVCSDCYRDKKFSDIL